MEKINILWVDDEIDLLKPHVLFLEEKGYRVVTANNGDDALNLIDDCHFDIVFLDEQMPGLSGLETLSEIKNSYPDLPVVMITKSEEENLMDDAIGSKISDYLIKPVNPKQILLSIKKNIETKRLVSEKTTSAYQQEFRNIGMALNDDLSHERWIDIYKKIVYWELELESSNDSGMNEILQMQKVEANNLFCRFIQSNYLSWLNASGSDENFTGKREGGSGGGLSHFRQLAEKGSGGGAAPPVLSHTLFKNKVIPLFENRTTVFLILIDNLRYDQWKSFLPIINEHFRIETEELYYSILPTATQYSRNAIFAGLLPSEIEKRFPQLWVCDTDERGKNMHEEEFIDAQLKRLGKDVKYSYTKITNLKDGKKLIDNINNLMNNQLNVIIYKFVDMLSHARTEIEIIKELADDEAAYRSLTLSWFEHSPLLETLRQIARLSQAGHGKEAKLVITTDHGAIRVKEPSKVVGDKNITTNLRYKQGKLLNYDNKDVFAVGNPADAFLPKPNVSTSYIFAKEDKYFVYPNNYNYYANFFKNTFQHGGISMEEMLIPVVVISTK
ncbi:MAG: bifunctional response regulator/alkaline phosphatase family protein [Bacteroidota bacterium]